MRQSEIIDSIKTTRTVYHWVPLLDGIEVMAWPVRIDGHFVGVSARTADACASRLSSDGWVVSLTTPKIEDLIWELRGNYTILIVTHNMAQARRVSDECFFMLLGEVVEHGRTQDLFLKPKNAKTADYIEGRYG